MKAGLTRRVVVASGVLAALVATAFVILVAAIIDLRDAGQQARHSEAVLAAANELERLVIDLETGQRGFVITGDERFLEPWSNARQAFPQQAQALEKLAAARDADQARRAGRIAEAGTSYIREYSVPVVEEARRDLASARTPAVTVEGKRLVDALRADFDDFFSSERKLAAARREQSARAARQAITVASIGLAGSAFLVALFAGYLARVIVSPVRRAANMAGVLAGGDLSVRMPENGPGEIGALERSFNTMAASLETSREELRVLLEEQAALRRVATLVARAATPPDVFASVTDEVGRLLGAPSTRLLRYEPDGTATVVAARNDTGVDIPVGSRLSLDGDNIAAAVLQAAGPARMEDFEHAVGPVAGLLRQLGIRSALGVPIVVAGRLWGVMIAAWTKAEPLSAEVEARLAQFTELVATAIANADSRAELAASRARVVAAADESRRRIERDLHDGTQQRLVSVALDLRAAEAMVAPEQAELKEQLSQAATELGHALEDLREVSRGIHPAILSRGGLGPALKTLARRSAVPVRLELRTEQRFPEGVEVAAYYVVSEALTNVAKHAQASVVRITLDADERAVTLSIGDDGVGGADPRGGSGLVGLKDRIEALGGTIDIASPAGGGTSVVVSLPLVTGDLTPVVDAAPRPRR